MMRPALGTIAFPGRRRRRNAFADDATTARRRVRQTVSSTHSGWSSLRGLGGVVQLRWSEYSKKEWHPLWIPGAWVTSILEDQLL